MLPPIGFFGSAENMAAAPSTWATTWFVITTATPNYISDKHRNSQLHKTPSGLQAYKDWDISLTKNAKAD